MKKLFLLLLPALLVATACTTGKQVGKAAGEVAFTEGRNYFSIDDVTTPTTYVIKSQADLDKHLNPAATMSKDGMPTQVDFTKSFVIAEVYPITNRPTDFSDIRLEETDSHTLQLSYKLKVRPATTSSMRPMFFIVVDKQYADYQVKTVEK